LILIYKKINNSMKLIKKFENYKSREEMCDYLCNVCGYDMSELEGMSDAQIEEICGEKEAEMTSEARGEKWIQDAIKRPGALRKSMGKRSEEKISKSEISDEISKLKKKDKDSSKPGIQGLSKKDLTKFRQLNLAKTLKSMKESDDVDNYMFFANLDNICRMVTEILEMNHLEIDRMLTEEHDWATDHISKSKESISHVYNWLKST
jgi:transposase